jgi:hypothetical protein
MSRDIVDTSTSSDRLVVATGIEGQPADQLARSGVEDADVSTGDEQLDRLAFVRATEADVMEAAVMAQGDRPCSVDLVVANAEMDVGKGLGDRPGLHPGAVGL